MNLTAITSKLAGAVTAIAGHAGTMPCHVTFLLPEQGVSAAGLYPEQERGALVQRSDEGGDPDCLLELRSKPGGSNTGVREWTAA